MAQIGLAFVVTVMVAPGLTVGVTVLPGLGVGTVVGTDWYR
jgi:hypothetical protein